MSRADDGFSLIEVLAALVIVGIAVVVIAGAMGVSVFASGRHREQATTNAVLLEVVERVKSSAVPHTSCSVDGTGALAKAEYEKAARGQAPYNVPALVLPAGMTTTDIVITQILFYDGVGFSGGAGSCHDVPTDLYRLDLQQVTLRVTSPSGKENETLTFVKGSS